MSTAEKLSDLPMHVVDSHIMVSKLPLISCNLYVILSTFIYPTRVGPKNTILDLGIVWECTLNFGFRACTKDL